MQKFIKDIRESEAEVGLSWGEELFYAETQADGAKAL
jgi:hypothetical protein